MWRVCERVCMWDNVLFHNPFVYTNFMFHVFCFLYIGKTCYLTGYANKQFEFEFEFEFVNTSLLCADFTPELKRAFVTPLIKKLILDCEIFKNYRPVSNLSFVSKLIERIVCLQLFDHLKENDLYEVFQSAYRQLWQQHVRSHTIFFFF